jgi:hypothetical protein
VVRRTLALALVALVVVTLLSACGGIRRPEGVVERWLVSLNQGAAGEPWRYADDQASATIAPDWDMREPGVYDEIDVGTATIEGTDATVPFRVTTSDGVVVGGLATVGVRSTQRGDEPVVYEVTLQEPPPAIDGTWSVAAPAGAWIGALGLAAFLGLGVLPVIGAVRRRAVKTPRTP